MNLHEYYSTRTMTTKSLLILSLLIFGLEANSASHISLNNKVESFKPKFLAWAKEFNKSYPSALEELKRIMIWIENQEYIESHNQQIPSPSFTLDHNSFSDLTHDEYLSLNKLGSYGRDIVSSHKEHIFSNTLLVSNSDQRELSSAKYLNLPRYVNWVEEGAVTEAKNQGGCGSCWAFSAIGAIEGAKFINDGELVSLSEQMMMDCDNSDSSCEGGIMETGFLWEEREGGLCSEDDYVYTAKDSDVCLDSNCTEVPGTHVNSFTRLNGGDVKELMQSVAIQPTAIAMDAQSMEFQFYKDGVFNGTCAQNLDHGILAVGYGTDELSGLDYFLVKNSWGPKWGDNGFFKISALQTEPGGMGVCGILNNFNTAPTVF